MNPQEGTGVLRSPAGLILDPHTSQILSGGKGPAWSVFFKVVFLPGIANISLFLLMAIKLPQFSLFHLEAKGSQLSVYEIVE